MTDHRCPTFPAARAIVLVVSFLAGLSVSIEPAAANSEAGSASRTNVERNLSGDKMHSRGVATTAGSDLSSSLAVTAAADKGGKEAKGEVQEAKSDKGGKDQARIDEEFELQQMLVDAIDQVERNYVKGISRRELIEAAIEGVLRELDPYSTYINPGMLSEFRTTVEYEFGGIGIRVGMENGRLVVLSPMIGTPAYDAGLLAGDRIMEIDGCSTKGLSLDQAVGMLQGRIGSEVTLTVVHRYTRVLEKITVKRQRIVVDTVLGDRRKPDGQWDYFLEGTDRIGYVRITGFSRTTTDELRRVLRQLTEQKARAIVLDLRFNPGGLLSSAIGVSDLFLSTGKIVSVAGRSTKKRSWDATQPGTFEKIPVVVLVNHYTASAAEIVAAALQDNRRAIVMGERSWGKGSVQNIISLEHGHSALKLTTSAYHRPSGENIHRFPDATDEDKWGVVPDKGRQLRIPPDEMRVLLLDRQRRDVVRDKTSKDPGPLRPRIEADHLLQKAVQAIEQPVGQGSP